MAGRPVVAAQRRDGADVILSGWKWYRDGNLMCWSDGEPVLMSMPHDQAPLKEDRERFDESRPAEVDLEPREEPLPGTARAVSEGPPTVLGRDPGQRVAGPGFRGNGRQGEDAMPREIIEQMLLRLNLLGWHVEQCDSVDCAECRAWGDAQRIMSEQVSFSDPMFGQTTKADS